jgi:hypothetical protein
MRNRASVVSCGEASNLFGQRDSSRPISMRDFSSSEMITTVEGWRTSRHGRKPAGIAAVFNALLWPSL